MNPAHSTLEILRDAGLSAEQAEQAASAINQAYAGDSNRYGQWLLRACIVVAEPIIITVTMLTAMTVVALLAIFVNASAAMAAFMLFCVFGVFACNDGFDSQCPKSRRTCKPLNEVCIIAVAAAGIAAVTAAMTVGLWRSGLPVSAVWMAVVVNGIVSFFTINAIFND